MREIDYKALKKAGIMQQRQKGHFSLRLRVVGGKVPASQLAKIYEVADKYGAGYIHLTARQGIEIPFIKLADIDAVKAALAQGGVSMGFCGPRVRTITACQGGAVCPDGFIDTTALAQEFDARYAGRELPGKFKLGITGCHNNCLKMEENDLGVKGGLEPTWNGEQCIYCGLCAALCPAGAIEVDKEARRLKLDAARCLYCGKCAKSCPSGAWSGRPGYLVSLGGMFGSRFCPGKQILPLMFAQNQLFRVVDATLDFFACHGRPGERFRDTVERIGWGVLEKELRAVL